MFKKAVKAAKIKTRPQKFGFLAQGDDRKGAVAGLLKTLAAKDINVTAIDAVSAGAGRYAAILWVNTKDVTKAAKALGATVDTFSPLTCSPIHNEGPAGSGMPFACIILKQSNRRFLEDKRCSMSESETEML